MNNPDATLNCIGLTSQILKINYMYDKVLWYNTAELLLIGTTSDEIKLREDRLVLIEGNETVHDDLQFTYWGSPNRALNERPFFLAGFLLGPNGLRDLAAGADVYHDDLPYLEFNTSWLRQNCEAIAGMLLEQLETVQAIYDGPLDKETLKEIRDIQHKNAGNIAMYDLRRNADAARRLGDFRQAIKLLQRAVKWNPDNRDALRDLADLLESNGLVESAIECYRQVLKVDISDTVVLEQLGNGLARLGRRDEAIVEYERAVKEGGDDSVLHNNLGNAYALQGTFDKAIKQYVRALKLDPDSVETHNNLGNALNSHGEVAKAVEHYHRAIQLNPDFVAAHQNLAGIYASRDEPAKAIEELRLVVKLNSGDVKARNDLGVLLLKTDEVDAAVKQLETALRIRPDINEIRHNLEIARARKIQQKGQ